MKRIVLLLLVAALLVPAFAVDISLVDNEDGTATIMYTAAENEVVRYLAISVAVDAGAIDTIFDVNSEFIVFPDVALEAETGSPVADPVGKSTLDLSAASGASISLCMAFLDQTGVQDGASNNGTYALATIKVSEPCKVTLASDESRGGILGDGLIEGTIAGGTITDDGVICYGDIDGDGMISVTDLHALILLLGNNYKRIPYSHWGGGEYVVKRGEDDWNDVFDFDRWGDSADRIDIEDLQAMILLLGNHGHRKDPARPFLGYEYSLPCSE